jgi:hypothetical protein
MIEHHLTSMTEDCDVWKTISMTSKISLQYNSGGRGYARPEHESRTEHVTTKVETPICKSRTDSEVITVVG